MKFEFSAGGIVFRKEGGKIFILVSQHSQHHGWVFPKGLIGDKDEFKGQTKEETAVREVKEETGILGKILEPLHPVAYWYVMDEIKRKKTVYYYIMQFVSGDTSKHDWEMENVEWLSIEEVEKRLTFASDKKVWEEAKSKILGKTKS
ncbi:MAG TPA: NUDIX domain-containing protein [Patescibacteria group bacterium]|nr:NUDIX domain-containing protein [Patescibacteria group bacterium]